jgi:lipoate-protein ligase A
LAENRGKGIGEFRIGTDGLPMDEAWWLIPCEAGTAADNMALDEALLESAARLGRPILRFYAWSEAAATFGCFQRHAEIEASTPLRPIVRRPTAGGFVPHDADWTYSVVIPPDHSWYALRATESYCRVHGWIRDALSRVRVRTDLAPERDLQAAGRCFAGGWEQHDLVRDGRKIAGAAQRRNRLGLLIQGSVQPVPSGVARADWERAMLEIGGECFGARYESLGHDALLLERTAELFRTKYSLAEHNASR